MTCLSFIPFVYFFWLNILKNFKGYFFCFFDICAGKNKIGDVAFYPEPREFLYQVDHLIFVAQVISIEKMTDILV